MDFQKKVHFLRILNVAHPTWGVCRVVDGEARPVFKKSGMTLKLPLGNAAMVREHGNTMLQALAGARPYQQAERRRPARRENQEAPRGYYRSSGGQ